MERNSSEHLGAAELAGLLEQSRGSMTPMGATALTQHLELCPICREQFDELAAVDRQLSHQLKSARLMDTESSLPSCPSPTIWREVAGGLTATAATLVCVEHASWCDRCGPLLRSAVSEVADLNGEITDEERRHIATLASSSAEWQKRLTQRITKSGNDSHAGLKPIEGSGNRWFGIQAFRFAIAAVVLACALGASYWAVARRGQPSAVDELLANAYTQKRTLELRIPGAAYARLRVQKGPASSFTARPASLLKAEALIAAQLENHKNDPSWLQASARADILEGKYDAAVESLQRALELRPGSAELLMDLGTARFQRAQSEDRPEDFAVAFEHFSQVLALQPENATALFNRAIVAEHQYLYRQALDDWEHYLKLDAHSEWSDEARSHAESVRTKLKEHENAGGPLLSPEEVAVAASGLGKADTRDDVDRRVEQYLDDSLRTWLPRAYPEKGVPGDLQAQQALFFLADLTARNHDDRWLSDVLSGSSHSSFPAAVAALARASQHNDTGDYTASRDQAEIAAALFRGSGNRAGLVRAEFERAYSEQFARRTTECKSDATMALAQAEQHSYAWLQIQLGLEKAVCSLLGKDDWGADERLSRTAMALARKSGYSGLYVRALYFIADNAVGTGDLTTGLKLSDMALQQYWSNQIPAFRAYGVYNLLGSAPEFEVRLPHFVVASWGEATALADHDDSLLIRAWAHSLSARAAAEANDPERARREFTEAARLFALAPKTEASQDYVLWTEIRTAAVESRLGQFDSGIARLTRIQDQVQLRADKYIREMFYAALGDLELRNRRPADAELAFRPALESSERRLSSLNSESERIQWSKEAAPIYLGMAEAELVQGKAEAALNYFEWYLGAGARSGKTDPKQSRLPSALPDPAWLASRLPLLSTKTILAYGVLPDGLAIWVCDNRGVYAQWIPQSNQSLQELAARFHGLASDPASETAALLRDSQSLYRALIGPVEQRLEPGRTLVIEADGRLDQVPFEALIDSSRHYLIERSPIVHSLGQSMDASLHDGPAISKGMSALIVGSNASSQAEELIPLPDAADEADAIARDFHSPVLLKGPDATLSAVERHLSSASVFHFTGHSLARPNGAALVLASDPQRQTHDFMTADGLRRLDLHSLQLAVLSTCNTDAGNDDSRGFNHIAEALQRAGTPHVVASRWPVDAVVTRQFIEGFYRNALSGQSVSDAVRQTSRNLLADPRTSHPYYWSAFSAYGRP